MEAAAKIEEMTSLFNRHFLIDKADNFAKNSIGGALNSYWRDEFLDNGIQLEYVPNFEEQVKVYLRSFLTEYMNEGVQNMITNGDDKFFMDNFSKMKALNHGYRCLLNMVMDVIKSTINELDYSSLRFDVDKLQLVNLNEVLNRAFDRHKDEKKQNSFKHTCECTTEDISKWNSEEPFFPVHILYS